jgi:hypothetical protein
MATRDALSRSPFVPSLINLVVNTASNTDDYSPIIDGRANIFTGYVLDQMRFEQIRFQRYNKVYTNSMRCQ